MKDRDYLKLLEEAKWLVEELSGYNKSNGTMGEKLHYCEGPMPKCFNTCDVAKTCPFARAYTFLNTKIT